MPTKAVERLQDWAVNNWVVFHLCRYACKDARYLLSVALSFGWWVIVPPRRKRVAEQRNIFVVSPDLNCWGWMIEQRKSGNIWAVAILPRLGVLFYGIQARKASSLNNWSEKESWLNLWWIQEDLLYLQQKSHLSALALALFCYPPYCKVGFFVPFWDYFGTFG